MSSNPCFVDRLFCVFHSHKPSTNSNHSSWSCRGSIPAISAPESCFRLQHDFWKTHIHAMLYSGPYASISPQCLHLDTVFEDKKWCVRQMRKAPLLTSLWSAKLTVCSYEKATLQVLDKDAPTTYTLGYVEDQINQMASSFFIGSIEDGPLSHFTCDTKPWFLTMEANVPKTEIFLCNWSSKSFTRIKAYQINWSISASLAPVTIEWVCTWKTRIYLKLPPGWWLRVQCLSVVQRRHSQRLVEKRFVNIASFRSVSKAFKMR